MTAHYDIVPATAEHIDAIAETIRQADCDECWAGGAMTARDALKLSLAGADLALTWSVDGVPAAIGGITGRRESATIWLLTTDLVDVHRRQFLADSRMAFDAAKRDYDLLFNFVDVRNRRAIRWLKWLGFTIEAPQPYGPFGNLFHFFWWRRREAQGVEYDDLVQ